MLNIEFRELSEKNIEEISILTQQLNPKTDTNILVERQKEMFGFNSYHCFGVYLEKKLIGVSSGWLIVKLYSGKQIELDNYVIDKAFHSQGIGGRFLDYMEDWAKKKGCTSMELNAYIKNNLSHKFYFNKGFSIVGFHFIKSL